MRSVFPALIGLAFCFGCIEENKTDCRGDGDCRGVRVCLKGVCVTPDELGNSGQPTADVGASDSGPVDVVDDGGDVMSVGE